MADPEVKQPNDAMDKLKGTTVSIGTKVLEFVGKVEPSGGSSTPEGILPGFNLEAFLKPYVGKKVKVIIEEVKEI